jgi:tRNA (guanine-N7-)-methyltransferase
LRVTGIRVARTLKQAETRKNIEESGLVKSSQTGIHPQLEKYVCRHLEKPWSQPFHSPSTETYRHLKNEGVLSEGKAIILDSGCGTGKSTQRLAELFPRHIVIGIDQSQVRLAKSGVSSGFSRNGNCILLRAELSTFWRLLLNDGHTPERHFLFYPNPWPKPGHLKRRWHGHPVFPHLLSLGGEIEMRCNWEIYALEFARAVNLATGADVRREAFHPESGISPFEQKYMLRDQSLFSVVVPAQITQAFCLGEGRHDLLNHL